MPLDFGQLSFKEAAPQMVGMPLDVIDKVGGVLTERYYRNRQGASQLKQQVLAIPDSNSDVNQKIIDGISKDVASKFSEFTKEDNWHDADKAVFDVADELMANKDVKALHQYSAMAAKVDDVIEKSGATEADKQLARQFNMKFGNKGIKNEKGEYQSYGGIGLSTDADVTKFYKQYDELGKGFLADIETYEKKPDSFNMDTASEGFKEVIHHFGKDVIKTVSRQEVNDYLMSVVASDTKLDATIQDRARLDLFKMTGEAVATKEFMKEYLVNRAEVSPLTRKLVVSNSASFIAETKGMKDAEKDKYYGKIMSNPDLKAKYLLEGGEGYTTLIGGKSQDASKFTNYFVSGYKGQFLAGLEAIVNKNSSVEHTTTDSYVNSSINGEMYKSFKESLNNHLIMTDAGQMETDNAEKYMDVHTKLNATIDNLKFALSNAKLTDAQKADHKRQIQDAEASLAANDLYIDEFRNATGLTNEVIYDRNKSSIIGAITRVYETANNPMGPSDMFNPPMDGYMGEDNKFKPTALYTKTKEVREITFDVLKGMHNKSTLDIQKALESKGVNMSVSAINEIVESANDDYKNTIKREIKEKGIEHVSNPFFAVGQLGVGRPAYTDATDYVRNEFHKGAGNFKVISAPKSQEDYIGTTNAGLRFSHDVTKGKNVTSEDDDIVMEPAFVKTDSPMNTSQATYRVYNKSTGESMVVQYMGNNTITNQMYEEMVGSMASNVVGKGRQYKGIDGNPTKGSEKQNWNRGTDFEVMRSAAGVIGGNIPAISVGSSNINGNLTLAAALEHAKLQKGSTTRLEDVKFKHGDNTFTVKAIKTPSGKYDIDLFVNDRGTEHKAMATMEEAASPHAVVQFVGAYTTAINNYNSEVGRNIDRAFGLNMYDTPKQ